MRRLLPIVAVLFFVILAYLVLGPDVIQPVAFEPGTPYDVTGKTEPATMERISIESGVGPEHVAVGPDGALYTGLLAGQILRIKDGQEEVVADTGGRPLGMAFDSLGRLIVCDAKKGLLSFDPGTGKIDVLVSEYDGKPLTGANDLAIAADGAIYFSDSSDRFAMEDYILDILEGQATGSIYRYDPATGTVSLLAQDLHFANGLALVQEDRFLLVNETSRYRVTRIPLQGGGREIFIDNLPGFPDGLDCDESGTCWVAIVEPRSGLLDALAPWPFFRRIVARLPRFLIPMPPKTARVMGFDLSGRLVKDFYSPDEPKVVNVSSANPAGGVLYLGSLDGAAIGTIRLSK